jgi:plasmid maintenance system antidote protein VapI
VGKVIQFPIKRVRELEPRDILRCECKKQGFKAKDLAEMMFVSPSAMSRYINGSRPMPDEVTAEVALKLESMQMLDLRCQRCLIEQARRKLKLYGPGSPAMALTTEYGPEAA